MTTRTCLEASAIMIFCCALGPIASGCGGASRGAPDDVVRSGPGPAAAPAAVADPATPAVAPAPENDPHPCRRPIVGPREAFVVEQEWLALDVAGRERCGLDTLERFTPFRPLPAELLVPLVEAADQNAASLDAWMKNTIEKSPRAVRHVVAALILEGLTPTTEPQALVSRRDGIRARLAALGLDGHGELAPLLAEVDTVAALLPRVQELHRLRCLLEVNPLGFAVACQPIHPQGRPITIAWRAATRDGVIEELGLERCVASTCKKLAATASALVTASSSLVVDVKAIKSVELAQLVRPLLVLSVPAAR